MENFKISEFNKTGKIIFKDGELIKKSAKINGEITLYNLDADRIKLINEEVIQKLSNNVTEEEVAYNLLPYLGSIDIDVSLDEFEALQSNALFRKFITEISVNISKLFSQIKESDNKLNNAFKENPELEQMIEKKKIKTKDEVIDDLMSKLLETKGDVKKRDSILAEINKVRDKK
jgi:hypothetical protein